MIKEVSLLSVCSPTRWGMGEKRKSGMPSALMSAACKGELSAW